MLLHARYKVDHRTVGWQTRRLISPRVAEVRRTTRIALVHRQYSAGDVEYCARRSMADLPGYLCCRRRNSCLPTADVDVDDIAAVAEIRCADVIWRTPPVADRGVHREWIAALFSRPPTAARVPTMRARQKVSISAALMPGRTTRRGRGTFAASARLRSCAGLSALFDHPRSSPRPARGGRFAQAKSITSVAPV